MNMFMPLIMMFFLHYSFILMVINPFFPIKNSAINRMYND